MFGGTACWAKAVQMCCCLCGTNEGLQRYQLAADLCRVFTVKPQHSGSYALLNTSQHFTTLHRHAFYKTCITPCSTQAMRQMLAMLHSTV